jgi:hypothetical protein
MISPLALNPCCRRKPTATAAGTVDFIRRYAAPMQGRCCSLCVLNCGSSLGSRAMNQGSQRIAGGQTFCTGSSRVRSSWNRG